MGNPRLMARRIAVILVVLPLLMVPLFARRNIASALIVGLLGALTFALLYRRYGWSSHDDADR